MRLLHSKRFVLYTAILIASAAPGGLVLVSQTGSPEAAPQAASHDKKPAEPTPYHQPMGGQHGEDWGASSPGPKTFAPSRRTLPGRRWSRSRFFLLPFRCEGLDTRSAWSWKARSRMATRKT